MKKSLPIFIFVLFFALSIKAQESTTFSNTDNSTGITKTSFFEWNFGIALVSFDTDAYIPFPGASALWGTTFINQENLIFEYEVGFAFPTLVTGKIGVGKRFNNTNVVVGVDLGLLLCTCKLVFLLLKRNLGSLLLRVVL